MESTQISYKHGNIQENWQETAELEVTGITLLSTEEAKKVPEELRDMGNSWWWLRSPGTDSTHAAHVGFDGDVSICGDLVGRYPLVVRPALQIGNLESLNLAQGDEIEVAGHKWTVIPGGMALCNEPVGQCKFRDYEQFSDDGKTFLTHDGKEYPIEELNNYERSDVKAFIEGWAIEKGILTAEQAYSIDAGNHGQDSPANDEECL